MWVAVLMASNDVKGELRDIQYYADEEQKFSWLEEAEGANRTSEKTTCRNVRLCYLLAMAKVDCFAIHGTELWFNSNDHLPPHFHASTTSWEARVFFMRAPKEMFELKWGTDPTAKKKRELCDRAEENRVELLQEWERKVNISTPGPQR